MSNILPPKRRRPIKIFFDGGCRPNPGRMEVAVVARGRVRFFDDLGEGSNGDAEWLALRYALEVAHALGDPLFDLVGDSRNVIDQARGAAPCRTPTACEHRARYVEAIAALPPRRLRWVPRQQNLAGIALSRRRQL